MLTNRRFKIILIFLICVACSFWLISRYPALDTKAALSGTEAFEDPLTNEAHFHASRNADFYTRVMITTLNWYQTNWRGMAFGLVIAAGFYTLLKYTPRQSSDRRFRNSFMGMFVGTPLGVCVNCVAPIAKGMYEAGSKMETALAVMFSSPTLNIIVLTMLFSIFPFYMALAKLLATFVLILIIVPLISDKKRQPVENSVCEIDTSCDISNESWPTAFKGATVDYLKGLRYIFIRTVPLMLLAGVFGAVASHLWSFDKLIGVPIKLVNLSLISFMGTLMPLPIAFDLMLAQALMMSGLAPAFVTTMLFTLGTFSIYSAMIVARTFSVFLAIKLFIIVSVIGIALGYITNAFIEYRHIQWLQQYDQIVEKTPITKTSSQPNNYSLTPMKRYAAPIILKQENITLQAISHEPRNLQKGKLFTVKNGTEMGITYSNSLTPSLFLDPLFFGRGIASGDFDHDGWTDFAIATDNGFELYQNLYGKKFKKAFSGTTELKGKQAINIAMVDLNNDGWLDIFLTTLNEGNFVVLNPIPIEGEITVKKVPNGNAFLTSASAFSDIDHDGYLDIINGNYYLGILTRKPVKQAADQLVFNRNLDFTIQDMEGIPGQTHSVLLSDFNLDGQPDLVIGNDYRVADTYYHGQSKGVFNKIRHQDKIIPLTTQNTMSIDTGDFNNDLIPDIYLANIGMSRGLDVVSNIFGDTMQNVGLDFCESGKSVLDNKPCYRLVKLATLLNPEKQDITEKCTLLGDPEKVQECMVMRMVLVATARKDKSLCNKISEPFMLNNLICNKYFEAQHLQLSVDEEIPMQTQFNLLLSGQTDHTFKDVSKQTEIFTAEWSWNARFADLDNDQWQDLYVVNGVPITQEFAANNFFHNQNGQTFKSAEQEFGLDDYDHSSSYTYLDIDRDGDLDIIANTLYGPFKVYTNHETKNNSATFKFHDEQGNRFCLGCKIIIHYGPNGEKHQFREIKTGGGFHSYDAPEAHFGLGKFNSIQKIEITWSTGETTSLEGNFPANHEYIVQRK
ncbi:MAG: VCBS repeat-containing protein [Nitrospinae bacterium]|nr:VCBS repeat-containing protein [Nitrospinota bacterium]